MNRAILFMAWGEAHVAAFYACLANSRLPAYPVYLITDQAARVEPRAEFEVIRANFRLDGLVRKAELIDFVPRGFSSYLLLDTDTRVLEDITWGFEKAEQYGIAAAPAPHYSLDHFWGFGDILQKEGLYEAGQIQYNTGVIFFSLNDAVINVFQRWKELVLKYRLEFPNDQPFFSAAMEQLGFNPYTVSYNYNYRGFGDPISGIVRVWHSPEPVPEQINVFRSAWPRRLVINGQVKTMADPYAPSLITRIKNWLRGIKG